MVPDEVDRRSGLFGQDRSSGLNSINSLHHHALRPSGLRFPANQKKEDASSSKKDRLKASKTKITVSPIQCCSGVISSWAAANDVKYSAVIHTTQHRVRTKLISTLFFRNFGAFDGESPLERRRYIAIRRSRRSESI